MAPPLLRQNTPIVHIQSTPQQTDLWTCGLHMLLINLTTIYQGRIPTLTHTQHHAGSLSRSHLRYIIPEELDAYVTGLIHDLANPSRRAPRTYHTLSNKHTKPIPKTNNENASPLPTPTFSRKRTYTIADTPTLHQPTPLIATQNPPKKARQRKTTTPHTDSPTKHTTPTHPRPNMQPSITTRTTHPRRKTRRTPMLPSNSNHLNIFQCKA